jgi:hypothetical protein
VVERGHRRGGQAQHEAIEGQVVAATAHLGGCIIRIVAPLAMPSIEVLQAQHIVGGLGLGRRTDRLS